MSFYIIIQVKWSNWMVGIESSTIGPETKYSDIIVPTIDTVSTAHLLEILLTNNKTVSMMITLDI